MAELARPFEMLWQWIDRIGGYPGKMIFVGFIVMAIILGFTWYSNRS